MKTRVALMPPDNRPGLVKIPGEASKRDSLVVNVPAGKSGKGGKSGIAFSEAVAPAGEGGS